jgi:hypothetical protein
VVRRLSLLAALVLGLAACGADHGSSESNAPVKITFGLSGGTMAPFSATIATNGAVTTTGFLPGGSVAKTISKAQEGSLSKDVRDGIGGLKDEDCANTFPDESGRFITALGKTVTVRGDCETGFTKLWNELSSAVGVRS